MTTVDEKEILEIEKLKAEYKRIILDIEKNPLDIQKMVTDMRHSSQRNVLLAIAVTIAVVTAFFKIQGYWNDKKIKKSWL